MDQQTGSKLGKEYVKAVCCYPTYLTYMQSTSCEMPGWMKHRLESRLPGEISIASKMQMTPLMPESEEELKSLLMKDKEENGKVGLKLNILKDHGIHSHHFMAHRWGNNGNSERLYFLGPQNHCMILDGDAAMKLKDSCSLEEML